MAQLNYEDMVIVDEREIFSTKINNRFEGRKNSDWGDKSKTTKEKCGLKDLKFPKPNNYNVKG